MISGTSIKIVNMQCIHTFKSFKLISIKVGYLLIIPVFGRKARKRLKSFSQIYRHNNNLELKTSYKFIQNNFSESKLFRFQGDSVIIPRKSIWIRLGCFFHGFFEFAHFQKPRPDIWRYARDIFWSFREEIKLN